MGASIIAKNPPTKTSNTFHLFTHLDKNKCSPTWPEMWHVFLFTPTTSRHMRSGDEVVWKNDEPNPPTKPPVRWVINLLYKSSSMDGNEWSWWFNQTISQICSHILLANGVRKIAITKVPSAAYHIHNWVVLEIGVLQKSLISFLEMTNFCMNLKSPILRKTDNCPKQLHLLHCIPQYPNIFFFLNSILWITPYTILMQFSKISLQSSFSPSSTFFSWWNSVPNLDHFPALRPFVLHQRSLSTLGASSYSPCLLPPRAPAVHLWPRCLRMCTARGPRGYLVIYLWLGYPPML